MVACGEAVTCAHTPGQGARSFVMSTSPDVGGEVLCQAAGASTG